MLELLVRLWSRQPGGPGYVGSGRAMAYSGRIAVRLEAVTVSVDYGDLLAATLRHNCPLFDRMVVVSTPADEETQEVCHRHDVRCVLTDEVWMEHGFAKGVGINRGLAALKLDGWVLHLDADVVLPPHSREVFDQVGLDESWIYGFDRHMVVGAREWARHLERALRRDPRWAWAVLADAHPVGSRVARRRDGGWVPIGFAQLWNPRGSKIYRYVERRSPSNPNTDVAFARQWPRRRRGLIPEIFACHLSAEAPRYGANWNGRTTARFKEQSAHIGFDELRAAAARTLPYGQDDAYPYYY